jgi:cytochrome c553
LKHWVVRIGAVLIILIGALLGYLILRKPATAPPSQVKVERTPERLARGKYLFENLADCAGCHSERHWDRFGGPEVAGMLGAGFAFPPELGLPGDIVAPNITPDVDTGIGAWTDGEKIRAIREGVAKDGRALFNFMPYQNFARMSDEDVYAVVAYMNSLPPVRAPRRQTSLNFPVNLLYKSAPRPVGSVPPADPNDRLRYGEYVTTLALCGVCHSRMDKGEPVKGMEFAGGEPFRLGQFVALSANLTPDEETGLGKWTEERFVSKFRGYAALDEHNAPRTTQANFTVMPWLGYAQLSDADLRAIYAYLRTLKPVYNPVDTHPAQPPQF